MGCRLFLLALLLPFCLAGVPAWSGTGSSTLSPSQLWCAGGNGGSRGCQVPDDADKTLKLIRFSNASDAPPGTRRGVLWAACGRRKARSIVIVIARVQLKTPMLSLPKGLANQSTGGPRTSIRRDWLKGSLYHAHLHWLPPQRAPAGCGTIGTGSRRRGTGPRHRRGARARRRDP